MKLNINEEDILLINVYMPTTGQDNDYKIVLDSLKERIKMEEDDTIIIITGDLNTRPDKKTPRNKWLEDFLKELNLTIHTPLENTHRSHRWGTETTLDYVITSRHISKIKLNVLNNGIFPNNLSSHFPLIVDLELDIYDDIVDKNKDVKNHRYLKTTKK